jgi:hypothetical protein
MTAEMQDPNTFINAGWDFVGESDNGPSDIWIMPEDGGYPILSWQVSPLPALPGFSGGTGEPDDPYLISTPHELNSIGHNPRLMSANFKLVNDVNLEENKFFPIGHEGYPFRGMFDGDEHNIVNFSYQATPKYRECVGLFRYIRGIKAELVNLRLKNANVVNNITHKAYYVGALVGVIYEGAVYNCHVEDSQVTSKFGNKTGGMIGSNNYGIVERCSSVTNVLGEYIVGGLVGSSVGIVVDCRSSGDVSGHSYIGGLAGTNDGYILDSHANAIVLGDTTSSFGGGLVGDNITSLIMRCSASGSVSVGVNGED